MPAKTLQLSHEDRPKALDYPKAFDNQDLCPLLLEPLFTARMWYELHSEVVLQNRGEQWIRAAL